MITLFYGGDVNIGRTMNRLTKRMEPFVGIEEMTVADLRLVNLECVIATKGEQTAQINTYFLRARPEQTNILVKYNIDVVLTANNHAGDYGKDALLEQSDYLDSAGILHAGSGKNFSEAFAPVYKKVDDVTLAIFSVDSTRKSTAATADTSGTAYLPANNLALWKKVLAEKISEAHKKAHVVIVAPHWGVNSVQKPSEQLKKIGHLLIDLGADAVLGTHAHYFMGVENYKARPIIYDAGDFLFDSKKRGIGCFTLDISTDGVEKVRFIPLVKRPGQTERAKASAPELQKMFIERCAEFHTPIKPLAHGVVEISFEPPPRFKIINSVDTAQIKRFIAPITEPRPEWLVDKVPQDAIISQKDFGGLKLVGYRVPPECRVMTKFRMLYVETYWTIDEPTDKNYLLSIRGVPVRECDMPAYGAGQAHEFLDNMYPTDRWKAGVIYREKFALLAPLPKVRDKMANIDLQISIRVLDDGKVIDEFKAPDLIKMRIESLPIYNSDFDDVIYQSEAGKCWTAEQLAKVTGGEWIVAPPEGWHVQTVSRNDNNVSAIQPRPTFFAAVTSVTDDHYNRIRRKLNQLDGAIVTHEDKNLPPDFPQLKVENPVRATVELGFAARKRFQGKVIAVTGSSGKTTTCNMLSHVLGKDNQITATPGTTNTYLEVAWVFASVKQNDAFAIIEMALGSLNKPRGSITYDITPHVAVVTSIAPAHVANVGTLEEVARYKSRIFCGMTAGSYAILNRDMIFYEVFEQKAKSLKLNVITFGKHPDATIKMPVIADGENFSVAGKTYKLSCPVPAEQIYDALAVVGVSLAVGFPIEKTLEYLKTFTPVKGRGNVLEVNRGGKNLRLIDSTFNANPLSMKFALEHLKTFEPNQKSRVAILGDMAELGELTVVYHKVLAETMLAVAPDRLLLCGELMRHPFKLINGKLNATWFETLDELLKKVESYLRDGDTILIKSSHATGLSKVMALLSGEVKLPPATRPALNVPKPLFDVKNFLPPGITPEHNGRMPADKLKKIHCGGLLYIDAARAWLAMVRAAAQDKVFLNVNAPFKTYRKFDSQVAVFKKRFAPAAQNTFSDDAIRVEFEGAIWQLKPEFAYAAIPGTSSHGYGLAVDIGNTGKRDVKDWLAKNAEQFGFVKEYDFETWHFTYVKSREGIPARVLEIEKLPPEPTFTAEEIQRASGCEWLKTPPEDWSCNGMIYARPLKVGCLAVAENDEIGISTQVIDKIFRQLAGIICVDPEPFLKYKIPLLVTANVNDTIKKLAAIGL